MYVCVYTYTVVWSFWIPTPPLGLLVRAVPESRVFLGFTGYNTGIGLVAAKVDLKLCTFAAITIILPGTTRISGTYS